jgi:hypothetical protein
VSISSVATPRRRNGGPGDLMNQRDAAAPEAGVVGLPHDRDVADDIGTAGRDQARAVRFRVIGQVPPRLGLAVTDPFDEEPDGRLGITLVDGLNGNAGNAHGRRLTYAQRRTLVAAYRVSGRA